MKLFSRTIHDYPSLLKWGVLALFVLGLMRFAMGPLGVPISVGGKATSITIGLLIAVIAYAVYFARNGGRVGDVIVSAVTLALTYAAVIAVFLSLSDATGAETYFMHPNHFRGTVGGHVVAHLRVTPIVFVAGSVVSLIVFGVGKLVARVSRAPSKA